MVKCVSVEKSRYAQDFNFLRPNETTDNIFVVLYIINRKIDESKIGVGKLFARWTTMGSKI